MEQNQNIPNEVMEEVDKLLEEKFKDYPKGLGFCHIYWNYKKNMLLDRGYYWQSPQDLDPNAIYD